MKEETWLHNLQQEVRNKSIWHKNHPKIEYRMLNNEWQVYSEGLIHIAMCSTEEDAQIIVNALRFQTLT